MKKLLLKLLGNSIYQPEQIDVENMQKWLYLSYKDSGFKSYYTMRKKYLVNMMLTDLSDKDRHEIRGRLFELQGLQTNITAEWKKRKLENKETKKKP